jgi:glyoxylase-like metal-dependent hydrolase (beta-lactamase superfamily II)
MLSSGRLRQYRLPPGGQVEETSGMIMSHIPSSSFIELDRRRFLAAAGGLVAAGILPKSVLAMAKPHSFRQGDLEVTVISDGHLVIPTSVIAANADPEELKALLNAAGITGTEVQAATNVTLIRSGDDLVLFDTGSGDFVPTAGKLVENLRAAGVEPDAVAKVVFTHAHPDHAWGTLGADDAPVFANAEYYVAAAEWDFWMNKDLPSQAPEQMRPMVVTTQAKLGPVKDRVTMLKPGDEIFGGVRVLDAPGHTPGHAAFEVPGEDGLIILGDVINNPATGFPHPEWHFGFDSDPEQAVATRKAILDRAATDRIKLLGFHWTYPGLGHAERKDAAYRYVPVA